MLLQRLFPEISVDDNDFSKWLDEFETKAQEEMQNTLTKVTDIQTDIHTPFKEDDPTHSRSPCLKTRSENYRRTNIRSFRRQSSLEKLLRQP